MLSISLLKILLDLPRNPYRECFCFVDRAEQIALDYELDALFIAMDSELSTCVTLGIQFILSASKLSVATSHLWRICPPS